MKISTTWIEFNCPTLLVAVYLLLLILLINLGFWQLNRAEEKKTLLQKQQIQSRTELKFNKSTEDKPQVLRYKPVQSSGRYDIEHQFLLDNQIFRGKAGYFVLTPFLLQGTTKAVLVNRGWIPANPDRKILPDLRIKTLQTTIRGRINNFARVGIKLAGVEIPTNSWPAVVQVVNSDVLAKKLGYPLFSFQIELAADMTDGYDRHWLENTVLLPEQHVAYALQWFGLAITLSIIFFWFSSKKNIR